MPTTRNKRSIADLFQGFDTTLRHYFYDRPRAWFEVTRRKFRDLPRTNFGLGCDFAERGLWNDAIFRFKIAIWLQPNFPQAWYNLGTCYLRLGKRAAAKRAYQKTLSMRPNHTEATYMLSGLDPNAVPPSARPSRMPRELVSAFFTQMAPGYNDLQRANQYAGPRLIHEALQPMLKPAEPLHMADLGCGTGLLDYPWRGVAAEITGIDLCPAMLDQARAAKVVDKALFERLLEEDLLALPEDAILPRSFNLALCIDTAQFMGELGGFMARVSRMLKPGGLFAITAEPLGTPAGYAVNPANGRFGHHPEYIKRIAAQSGFELKRDGRINLYPSLNEHLFVFALRENA